jgi:hypothetical protein
MPHGQEPQVRARYMQGFVADINRLPSAHRRAIGDGIHPATRDVISAGTMLGWVPFAVNLECTRAVATALGPERAHLFFRGLLLGAANTTLLAGLVQSALRFAIPEPGFYLPFMAKGFDILFRNCGRLSVHRNGPTGAVTELRGLPLGALQDPCWIDSVASSLSALTDLIAFESTVNVLDVDLTQRVVKFSGKWRAREAPRPVSIRPSLVPRSSRSPDAPRTPLTPAPASGED